MKRNFTGFLAAFLAVMMLVSVFPMVASAAAVEYTDVENHWAENTVKEAAANGLDMLTGDKFYPDQAITREQFVRMANWAFGLTTAAESVTFTDVEKSDVYYNDILAAAYAKYIHGRSAMYFDPQTTLTREEAAIIIYNMIPTCGVEYTGTIENFIDYSDIQPWALAQFGTIVNMGYIKGYPDGSAKPLGTLTNAEALTILMRVVANTNIRHSDFTVKDGDVYSDTVFTGTITVPAGAKVTFSNCVILGKVVCESPESKAGVEEVNDTFIANIEYGAEKVEEVVAVIVPVIVKPEPIPCPEPDDGGDIDVWFE